MLIVKFLNMEKMLILLFHTVFSAHKLYETVRQAFFHSMKLHNGHCLPSRVDRMIDKMPFHHKITVYFSTFFQPIKCMKQ